MADVAALLQPALQDNRDLQSELFHLVEKELGQLAWHWIRRYSAQESVQVSEVLDQVFIKLMKIESPGWKHRGQFYSFACRNIPDVLIDLLRDQDRHRKLAQEEGDAQAILAATPQRATGLSEASLESLILALETLEHVFSPAHRQVVELKYFGEFTLDQIAEITSIHRSKVDGMLKIARACLRAQLETSFPEFATVANEGSGSTLCLGQGLTGQVITPEKVTHESENDVEIAVGSPEWNVLTDRRAALITKMYAPGQELTVDEKAEFDRLQQISRATIDHAFPRSRLAPEEMALIKRALGIDDDGGGQ